MIFSRPSQTSSKKYIALGFALLATSTSMVPTRAQTEARSPAFIAGEEPFLVPVPQGHVPLYDLVIPLRNVRPSIAAYWLNPVQVVAPPELRGLQSSGRSPWLNAPRLPGNGNGPLGLKLPDGIEAVAPIDSRNALLVRGTSEGLDALKKLVATFDVPLVQYEVEARIIQINRSRLSLLGVDFSTAQSNSPYEFGDVSAVPTDILGRIDRISKSGQAKILTAPRVIVMDGLEAELSHQVATPSQMGGLLVHDRVVATNAVATPQTASDQSPSPSPLNIPAGLAIIHSAIGVRVAVLAQPDHLLSLRLTPTFGNRSLTVETTVPEDQSFAIQMSPPKDKQQLVVIVTPKRIRRVSEE